MKEVPLKDICNKDSSSLKQKELMTEGKYPVYGASGIAGYLNSYHQKEAYIGIVKDGSGIGRVDFYPEETSLIGTMQYILPKKGYNIRYIGYCLQSLDLSKYKQGAAIPHIYFRDYGERIVKVTEDEREQKRIVERLDAAFAQIDELKANAEKQLTEARTLFQKSLAKAMEPKEGWEEKKLKDIVLTITDGDHQPPPKSSDGIPFITISNIDKESNKIDFEDTFHVPQTYFNGLKSDRIPQQGDVLYTVTGSFGIPVLIDYKKDFCFQRHIALIRPNQKLLFPEFLYYWILSDYAKAQAEDTATGAAQRTVSLNSLRKFNISIPPLSEQQRIVERLDSISENVRKYEEIQQKIIAECDALKQALLRQVFE